MRSSYQPTLDELQIHRDECLQKANQRKAPIAALRKEIQKLSWWDFSKKFILIRELRKVKRSLYWIEDSIRYYNNEISRFS